VLVVVPVCIMCGNVSLPERLSYDKAITICKDRIGKSFTIELLNSNVGSWFHENSAEAFTLWSTSNGCSLGNSHRGRKRDVDRQIQWPMCYLSTGIPTGTADRGGR
jgi:hypothetical protein